MKAVSENDLKKVQNISRIIFWGSIILLLSPALQLSEKYDLFIRVLFLSGTILFGLNWIMPVVFLAQNKRPYAYTWSKWMGDWEDIKDIESKGVTMMEKILIYIRFVFALLFYIMMFILFFCISPSY